MEPRKTRKTRKSNAVKTNGKGSARAVYFPVMKRNQSDTPNRNEPAAAQGSQTRTEEVKLRWDEALESEI